MENQLIPVDSLFVTAFTNQRLGQTADSQSATIQPTTWRLKMSRITYR